MRAGLVQPLPASIVLAELPTPQTASKYPANTVSANTANTDFSFKLLALLAQLANTKNSFKKAIKLLAVLAQAQKLLTASNF